MLTVLLRAARMQRRPIPSERRRARRERERVQRARRPRARRGGRGPWRPRRPCLVATADL